MITREAKRGGKVKVTFELPEGSADGPVSVVGDFNDWTPGATPMQRKGGARRASVTLGGGRRYVFRYLSEDGGWFNDDGADGYEPNPFGEMNGVVDLADGL